MCVENYATLYPFYYYYFLRYVICDVAAFFLLFLKKKKVADGFDVVVNCCGVRAGALSSDTETVPIRGQIRRVRHC